MLLLCALALVLLRLPGSIWLKVAGFGLLAGAATLVRPTGLLLPCLVLLLPGLGLASSPTRATTRHSWYRRLWHASRRVRLTLVAIVGAALIVVPVMVWNKRTHGVFALTTSLQRNMLYPIRQHPERLLRERGTGDRLLGQIKATIHYHPTSPWTGPYGGLLERFHLSNEVLDRLLVRVALDFVLADPLDYVGGIVRRLPPLLTESGATAAGLVQYGRQEYAIAGGPGQLGVREYDYAADLAVAHAFDRNTRFFNLRPYAWVLLALAAFGGGPLLRPVSYAGSPDALHPPPWSAGVIDDFSIVPRYTHPVTWVIYVLAAAGATGLFGTLRAALTTHGGGWRRLWPMQPVWPTIRRGLTARSAQSAGDLGGAERACHQLPPIVALLATAVVLVALVALAAAHRASAHRSRAAALPPVTLSGGGPPLDTQLDRLDWHLPAMYPVSRLVALSLPAQLAFDFVGPDGLIPDSQPDHPLLLTIGPEVQDLQTHALKFVELGSGDVPTWDTTGWYRPLLVIRVGDGEYISQHTAPRSKSLKLRPGDRLLVLADAAGAGGHTLRLHLDSGIVLSYPLAAEPLEVPWRDTTPAPQDWLAQHATSSARVAMVQRDDVPGGCSRKYVFNCSVADCLDGW